jgi:surface protein
MIIGEYGYGSYQEETNAEKLQKITQWGDIQWRSFYNSFATCINLDVNATDTPDLHDVNSTRCMFIRAFTLRGNKYFNDWDVSSITDMSNMFYIAIAFNQPLNNWDVSSVTNMRTMFTNAIAFNQPLNNWDVSSVTDMLAMFANATAFNQPLNNWNVRSVTNMGFMFYGAKAFKNQNLRSWSVGNVESDKHDGFVAYSGGGNIQPNW